MTNSNDPVNVVKGATLNDTHLGLTKREYFAIEVLKTMPNVDNRGHVIEGNCQLSVAYADELIKQLNQK